MASDQTFSVIYLWVLQIAWWLAAMLPLSVAGILIALGLRALHRQARAIEKAPVDSKPDGFAKLLKDRIIHRVLSQTMIIIIFGGLALGGIVGLFLQGIIHPGVQKAIESGGFLEQKSATPNGTGPSLDIIFFLSLVVGAVMLVLAVYVFRLLSQNAGKLAESLTNQEAKRPLIVRWFHDSRTIGLVVLIIGSWICFGLVMQFVGLIVVIVPWPAALPHDSFSWANGAVIWIMVALCVILFLALFSLPLWMSVRQFKLDVRYYMGNPTFRLIANVFYTFGAGAFGTLLFMNLLHYSGIAPFSDQWFGFTPAIWMFAYLIAYVATVLVQILICRKSDLDFTIVNIVVAFIVAFPGAIPLFFLLFSIWAKFLSKLFGQP
jgi:hypothetical protein